MAQTIYSKNDVEITAESAGHNEYRINVNGANLMWVSGEELEEFKYDLEQVLDKYQI